MAHKTISLEALMRAAASQGFEVTGVPAAKPKAARGVATVVVTQATKREFPEALRGVPCAHGACDGVFRPNGIGRAMHGKCKPGQMLWDAVTHAVVTAESVRETLAAGKVPSLTKAQVAATVAAVAAAKAAKTAK